MSKDDFLERLKRIDEAKKTGTPQQVVSREPHRSKPAAKGTPKRMLFPLMAGLIATLLITAGGLYVYSTDLLGGLIPNELALLETLENDGGVVEQDVETSISKRDPESYLGLATRYLPNAPVNWLRVVVKDVVTNKAYEQKVQSLKRHPFFPLPQSGSDPQQKQMERITNALSLLRNEAQVRPNRKADSKQNFEDIAKYFFKPKGNSRLRAITLALEIMPSFEQPGTRVEKISNDLQGGIESLCEQIRSQQNDDPLAEIEIGNVVFEQNRFYRYRLDSSLEKPQKFNLLGRISPRVCLTLRGKATYDEVQMLVRKVEVRWLEAIE
jgi:hypothetical protein